MKLSYDITEEQEIDIWKEYKRKPTQEIRDFFLVKYSPLVKYVAGKFINKKIVDVDDFDDLVSYGTFGLIDAASKFDPSKETKFKTYAITRIRGQIFDELLSLDRVPRSMRQKLRQIEKFRHAYKEHGVMNNNELIAKETGISISEVERISNMSNDSSTGSLNDYLNQE